MNTQAWIVAVDMGYGHQRAAYPLRKLAPKGEIILVNNYPGIPDKDRRIWKDSRKVYEIISRLKNVPLIGDTIFNMMDYFQKIPDFYPRRDLSTPTIQLKTTYKWIRKKKWGKDLIDFLNNSNGHKPFITTFFIPAFMAEEHGYKGDIYCVICDADCSRAWVPLDPKKSKIKYFAPCRRVVERLKLYGVKSENIFLTGFPLPKENLGGKNLKILKKDLAQRILNLDPCGHYRKKYNSTVKQFLHDTKLNTHSKVCSYKTPTLTFAVGGAGAQRELASKILISLKEKIKNKKINLNLIAGSRNDVYLYFQDKIKNIGLDKMLGKNLNILFAINKNDYFREFNKVLRDTDILWTKPSELVFYAAMGLPIIMAPSVGSQEDYNRHWLTTIGAGLSQDNPELTHEWLFDWINSGWLAESAVSGFLDERQFGTYSIEDVVFKGAKEPTQNYRLL